MRRRRTAQHGVQPETNPYTYYAMKKIDRRTFLRRAGASAATIAAGAYLSPYAAAAVSDNTATTPANDTPPRTPTGTVTADGNSITSRPEDNGLALVNPHMGWTMHFYSNILDNYGSKLDPADTLDDFPGLSTVYLRVPWAFVEPEEGRFVWELLDTPAQRWIDKGCMVAFRISAMESWLYSATPEWVFEAGAAGYDVDGHYKEPEYDDPIFLAKVEAFVSAMAERYDGKAHVAFVDIGHYGMWGEGHTVMTSPVHGHTWGIETQKRMIDLYLRHFRRTQLCISDDFAGHNAPGSRFPITDYAFERGVTIRDDSILVQPYPDSWYHSEMAQLFWPTMPVILEHEHYGNAIKRGSWDKDLLLKSVEDYHASYMSIHWWPRILLEENRDIIDRINRRLGYRLAAESITWPARVARGEEFEITSAWRNTGVAPCYDGGWPCYTIKDSAGGIVSVLVDETLDVRTLEVAAEGKATATHSTRRFRIAPRYADRAGTFFRACRAGDYEIYFSVGQRDGTPVYRLPYSGDDGHKRYLLGKITITE